LSQNFVEHPLLI